MIAADFAQVLAAAGTYPPQQQSTTQVIPTPGTTTTTTTTTVVVTHGNGETETIIEGDNLPPGTNEMIMSAAAAAFPLECYAPVGVTTGAGAGQVQVQSYQLGSPLNVGDLPSSLTTTTMHTTTIINSGNGNFPSPILLPPHPHHPPPLPQAFTEAAAAAGLVPPSGAPPEGAVKQQNQSQVQKQPVSKPTAAKVAQVQTQTQTQTSTTAAVKEKATTTVTKTLQPPVATTTAVPKKQTAKRSRPFSQGPQAHHGSCPNNHKGCAGHQAVGTQTHSTSDKSSKELDVDSATESNGETSLSIAAAQGHYEVVEFLLQRKAHIGKKIFCRYFPINRTNLI